MRLVSLVPAATEIACALGAADDLVAVTHDDDHPPQVRRLPRVTRTSLPPDATSHEIDAAVKTAAERRESTFHLDAGALRDARPDLILGQTLCAVCAITLDQVPRALRAPVVPLDASSLDGMLEDVGRVGNAIGRARAAELLVASLRARLEAVRTRSAGRSRPRVACLEWLDPLFNGGHWVPEQVEIAGGTDVLGSPGERSREIAWAEVVAASPDVLVLMPCGFDERRAASDGQRLRRLPGWDEVPAVRAGRVHPVDGNAFFSRPGPRLVDGAVLLARLFAAA